MKLANGGTLFLDEIGELPLDIQAKLLRILQEQEFERIGSTCTHKVDVRIIAATNRNLQEEVEHKRFREDLFYRLNVFPVRIPPLRERREDIPLLLKHIVNKFSVKHGKTIETITPESQHQFMNYSWPGNIRELENVIERAVIVSKGHILEVGNWLAKQSAVFETHASSSSEINTHSILSLEESERLQILHALGMTKWRVSGKKGAAHLLGINRSTLRSRMEKLGITRDCPTVSA